MCLAIPMQVVEINGFNAKCEAKGVHRDVSLFMLQDEEVAPGGDVLLEGAALGLLEAVEGGAVGHGHGVVAEVRRELAGRLRGRHGVHQHVGARVPRLLADEGLELLRARE